MFKQIHQITLNDFIRCTIDHDYTILSDEEATEDQLREAWDTIYEQYIDRIKDKDQLYILKLAQQINVIQTKIQITSLCLTRLSVQHSDEIIIELRKILQFPGEFNPEDPRQYFKDLELVVTISKKFYMDLEEKMQEYNQLTSSNTGEEIKHEYFDTLIVQVSKYMKFKINRFEILMSEFVSMLRDMKTNAEMMERKFNSAKK